MPNFRGAPGPMQTRKEESHSTPVMRNTYATCSTFYSWGHIHSSLLTRFPGRRLTDSLGKFLFFGRHAKRLWNLHSGSRLDDSRLRDPGFRVGLRIVDGEGELDGVAIGAMIPLDRAHLVAMRLALRAQPGLL